jgi:hypothetical protein
VADIRGMATHPYVTTYQKVRLRLGGSRGNEILTSVNAAVLVALLAVQLVTVLALDSMIRVHLFVGVVLLGPVALKLATTGYRFLRYYTGAREYREKGPPPALLRAIAPVFVAATIGLFATGVMMLIDGQGEGTVRGLHLASFWVWIGCCAVHVAFNGREVLHNLHGEWFSQARARIAGAQVRAALVLGSILGGVLVALALASKLTGYEMGG